MAALNVYQRTRERLALDLVQEAVDILDSIRGELGLEDELETQDLPPGSDERKLVNASNHLHWVLVEDAYAWTIHSKDPS